MITESLIGPSREALFICTFCLCLCCWYVHSLLYYYLVLEYFLLDAPAQVKLTALPPFPINGLSVTLTCTARAALSPKFRFILVNGSSSVIVQDGGSSNFTTLSLDYKEYNNYKATYQCIAYNRVGESPVQTLVLDIQGNSFGDLFGTLLYSISDTTVLVVLSGVTRHRLALLNKISY